MSWLRDEGDAAVNARCAVLAAVAVAMLVGPVAGGLLLTRGAAAGSELVQILGVALMVLTLVGGLVAAAVVSGDDGAWWVWALFFATVITIFVTVPGTYLGWFGRPTEAIVIAVEPCKDYGPLPATIRLGEPECVGRARLVESRTGRDLGWTDCADKLRKEATVSILVDSHGWFAPQRRSCVISGWGSAVLPAALVVFWGAPVALIVRQRSGLAPNLDDQDDEPGWG